MLKAGVTLYYVRHGETDWNRAQRYQGQRDIPINATGRSQAKANGRLLAAALGDDAAHLDYVASPLKRASETTEDPRGPIKLDDYGNPTENVYILKVERVGGKLVNTVLHTYPLVSQFWTYSAADFLKLPPYTRDYPPARP